MIILLRFFSWALSKMIVKLPEEIAFSIHFYIIWMMENIIPALYYYLPTQFSICSNFYSIDWLPYLLCRWRNFEVTKPFFLYNYFILYFVILFFNSQKSPFEISRLHELNDNKCQKLCHFIVNLKKISVNLPKFQIYNVCCL